MKCVTCPCTDSNLLKLQTFVDNTTLQEISFVLPDFVIQTQGPVYVCATCQEQVATFHRIKKAILENCCQLNLYKDILDITSAGKFNELKIRIDAKEEPAQREQNIKIKTNQNCNELFSTTIINVIDEEPEKCEQDINQVNQNCKLLSSEDELKKADPTLTPIKKETKYQRAFKKKRFKCIDCDATFAFQANLKAHTRIHTGERPFKCTTCDKTYIQSSDLNRHILTHTGEKMHKCDMCDKTFIRKHCLIIHKRGHTNERPFPCKECPKAFKRSGDLRTHMRIHSGEKIHQCHLCEYRCTQAGTLKAHIRTHTGEKPYTCELCQKTFTQSSSLQLHKRRLHNSNGDLQLLQIQS